MWKILCRRLSATRLVVAAGLLAGSASPTWAQGGIGGLGGGGGGGNSLGSVGGSGGGSSGGSAGSATGVGVTKGLGSGNISVLLNGNNPLSSLSTGGTTTNTATGGIPATSDPNSPYFTNIYSSGLVGTGTTVAFGQPVYTPAALPTPTAAATSTIQPSKAGTAATGFTSVGQRKAPGYVTTVGDDVPLIRHIPARLRSEVEQVLARSSSLKSKGTIAVNVEEGGVAVLTGRVMTARERGLAEALVRMTPGVQNVQNNLQVVQ